MRCSLGLLRVLRIIGLLSLGWLLVACSMVKMAYEQSPQLLTWWLDNHLDFNTIQSTQIREELSQLQQWHRRTQLPRYAELLQKIERLMPGSLTQEQVCSLAEDVRTKLIAISEQAAAPMATTAMTLNEAQIQHLEGRYAKSNKAGRKDWLEASPKAQAEKRLDQMEDRLGLLYGRLTDAQRELLRRAIASSPFDPALSHAERQRRQQDTAETLRQVVAGKLPQAQAQRLMQGYVARTLASPVLAYRTYLDGAIQHTCATLADLHNSTSPEQRDHAIRQLQAYAQDARDLAAAARER